MNGTLNSEPERINTRASRSTVDEPHVIAFPSGIPGFETCRRFVLIASSDLTPFSCLQALDPPRPSFLAIDPAALVRGWQCPVPSEEAWFDAPARTLVWLAVVTVTAEDATANLRAPIVINPRRMIGCQLIRDESPYSMHFPIRRV